MNVKGARPGRFTPKCERCKKIFLLIVPEDPTEEMVVKAVRLKPQPAAADGAALAPIAKAPATPKPGPSAPAAPPAAPEPSDDLDDDSEIEAALAGNDRGSAKPAAPADEDDDDDLIDATIAAPMPPPTARPAAPDLANVSDDDLSLGDDLATGGGDDDAVAAVPVGNGGGKGKPASIDDEIADIQASIGDDDSGITPAAELEGDSDPGKTAPGVSAIGASAGKSGKPGAPGAGAKKPPVDEFELATDELEEDAKPASPDVTAPSAVGKAKASARPAAASPDVTAPSVAGKAKAKPAAAASPDVTAPSAAPKRRPTADAATMVSKAGKTVAGDDDSRGGARGSGDQGSKGGDSGGDGDELSGKTLGGYEVIKRLGKGGMGSVYLAIQKSLDRKVALKTMHPRWASDPQFVARFTREAYAAAQLVHHNVIQIYDIGQENDTNFFSMEFVDGASLGGLVKEKGKLDVEEAVGYILQAARGLKFAHDQGMVHRDIKPDNLMVNTQGVVKVADLGLVKTPGTKEEAIGTAAPGASAPGAAARRDSKLSMAAATSATLADVAMGTPAYMAPEQGMNAAAVDHRADIYSLGCTLYVMVTGKPVHEGTTAMEVMSKHATESIVPPDVVVKRVPKALSNIILKMTAKKPEQRYKDISELIRALEDYLGINSTGPFTPREEHAALLEESVGLFNSSKKAKLRFWGIVGFYAIINLAIVMVLIAGIRGWGKISWSTVGYLEAILLAFDVLTTVAYITITGITQKTTLFTKIRQFIFSSRIRDWILFSVMAIMAITLLYMLGLLWTWLAIGLIPIGLAVGFHFVVDKLVAAERKPPVENLKEMLKSMRLKGLEEQALRQFVCKYAGEVWEEFYETLFGYEAKLEAREKWGKGDQGRLRKKFAAWRDPIIAALEAKVKARKEAKERRMLQKIEEKKLRAQGMSAADAAKKAGDAAEVMVEKAAEFQDALKKSDDDATLVGGKGPKKPRLSLDAGSDEDAAETRERARKRANAGGSAIMGLLFGRMVRFALGVGLLWTCYTWMNQNGIIPGANYHVVAGKEINHTTAAPLALPMVPEFITKMFFQSFNPGIAGAILVLSIMMGKKRCFFAYVPAALVLIILPGFPAAQAGPLDANMLSLAIAAFLCVVGYFLWD